MIKFKQVKISDLNVGDTFRFRKDRADYLCTLEFSKPDYYVYSFELHSGGRSYNQLRTPDVVYVISDVPSYEVVSKAPIGTAFWIETRYYGSKNIHFVRKLTNKWRDINGNEKVVLRAGYGNATDEADIVTEGIWDMDTVREFKIKEVLDFVAP